MENQMDNKNGNRRIFLMKFNLLIGILQVRQIKQNYFHSFLYSEIEEFIIYNLSYDILFP